jgi:hypothetical protein
MDYFRGDSTFALEQEMREILDPDGTISRNKITHSSC